MTSEELATPAPWKPLVHGHSATRIGALLATIARDLAPLDRNPAGRIVPGSRIIAAEIALFFSYFDAFAPDQGHDAAALWWLGEAMSRETREGSVALHEGLTFVAWVAAHLEGRLFDAAGDDPNADFDPLILELLEHERWAGEYELFRGLTGLGVYFLERWPRPSAARGLGLIIDHLAKLAEEMPGKLGSPVGYAWFTAPERLPQWQRELTPRGHYNLGTAHGLPGVLVVLAAAIALDVRTELASELLTGAATWMLEQKLPPGEKSVFPTWVPKDGEPPASRFGWCYGDAGIASTLLCAARATGQQEWSREALELGRSVAARSPDPELIDEPGLCHGAAGLATLLARLHFFSAGEQGTEELARGARVWANAALDLCDPEVDGAGGFWSLRSGDGPRVDPTFLRGAVGVGLALLSLVSDVHPQWHRLLTLSAPPIDGPFVRFLTEDRPAEDNP